MDPPTLPNPKANQHPKPQENKAFEFRFLNVFFTFFFPSYFPRVEENLLNYSQLENFKTLQYNGLKQGWEWGSHKLAFL